jgi:hypothetical protein
VRNAPRRSSSPPKHNPIHPPRTFLLLPKPTSRSLEAHANCANGSGRARKNWLPRTLIGSAWRQDLHRRLAVRLLVRAVLTTEERDGGGRAKE